MRRIEHIEDIQAVELGILDYFTTLCDREGLRYFAAQGTLLGAVRHGGFIPWDDDIDVCMPRPDFDRLLTLTGRLISPFKIISFEADARFRRSFVKIVDDRTVVLEAGAEGNSNGIWIDVFCVDGLGNNEKRAMVLHHRSVGRCKRILFCRNRFTSKSQQEKVADALCRFATLWVPEKILYRRCRNQLLRTPYDESRYVGRNVDNYGNLEVYERALIGDRTTVVFEGRTIYAPARYDAYLRHYYGDYTHLPPRDMRKPKHITGAWWKN